MKILATTIFLLAGISPSSWASSHVKVRHNKVHGFWNFVLALTNASHTSDVLRSIYAKSPESTPSMQKIIDETVKIFDRNFHYSYTFKGFPQKRPEMSWELVTFFNLQSGKSKALSDFSDRTMSTMPQADHEVLFSNLRALYPIYEKLVWTPSFKKLLRYEKAIQGKVDRSGWSKMLEQTKAFYQAHWSENLDFDIVIFPIPAAKGHSNATVIGNMASVEALLDEKDLDARLAVVYHEICHALFASESQDTQKKLDHDFSNQKSAYSSYAYDLFDEALATAIGNGWSYLKMTGKPETAHWYDNPHIDGFAHALYPEVSRRLESQFGIDSKFVSLAVEQFEKIFPDAPYDVRLRLKELILLTNPDFMSQADVKRTLKHYFRLPSVYSSEAQTVSDITTTFKDIPEDTSVIVIVEHRNLKQLKELGKQFPDLKPSIDKLASISDSGVLVRNLRTRMFYLIQVQDVPQLEKVTEKLKRLGVIKGTPEEPFISI